MDDVCSIQISEDSQDVEEDDPEVDCVFHADYQGLQSIYIFKGDTSEFRMIDLMCNANRFRGPVWGIIPMKKSVYEGLKEMLFECGPVFKKEILKSIKERKYSMYPSYQKTMDKIPIDGELPFI